MTHLTVRRLLIDLEQPVARHWCGGDAFLTAWFNALSMSFPVGEQFFIDSLRRGVKELSPDLHASFAQDINGFIGQEATHRRIHERFNQHVLNQGMVNHWEKRALRRIAHINQSLGEIDYNPGRFILLESQASPDAEIRDFQQELRACTEGAVTGSEDAQYSEAKFLQVKAIIDRFRGREGLSEQDRRWTAKVTDVRNWFADKVPRPRVARHFIARALGQ